MIFKAFWIIPLALFGSFLITVYLERIPFSLFIEENSLKKDTPKITQGMQWVIQGWYFITKTGGLK